MERGWKRTMIVLGVVAANIALDQLTKEIARQQLPGTPVQSYLGDTFRILFVENTGAFLSLGSGLSEGPRYWILTILPIIVLLILLVFTPMIILSTLLNQLNVPWDIILTRILFQ